VPEAEFAGLADAVKTATTSFESAAKLYAKRPWGAIDAPYDPLRRDMTNPGNIRR
jgi:hypothetical protein